jgi:hypothetical protein
MLADSQLSCKEPSAFATRCVHAGDIGTENPQRRLYQLDSAGRYLGYEQASERGEGAWGDSG